MTAATKATSFYREVMRYALNIHRSCVTTSFFGPEKFCCSLGTILLINCFQTSLGFILQSLVAYRCRPSILRCTCVDFRPFTRVPLMRLISHFKDAIDH